MWTRHIVETEAPGAFLDELIDEAPRLSTPAARLRREHNEILGVINRAEKSLDQVLLDDDHDVFVDTLRAELTEMLCALAHHRQRGADLIFAAYDGRHRRRGLTQSRYAAAVQLGGTGIWAHQLRYGDPGAIAEMAAELDELGYDALWIPDVGGDVLGSVETLLRRAPRAVVATGILNIWMHEPAEVAAQSAAGTTRGRARFLLGLGVSHAPLIDHGNPGRYNKPYTKMFEYLDGLDAAPRR